LVYHQFNVDPYYQELYFSKYVKLDPTSVGQAMAEIGQTRLDGRRHAV